MPIRTLYPLWVTTLVLVIALRFAVWFREGRWNEKGGAFQKLVYVTLALIAALLLVGLWTYARP